MVRLVEASVNISRTVERAAAMGDGRETPLVSNDG